MVLPVIKQTILPEILNLEGHLNCCIGSKVTVVLLNRWSLPTGGVASGRVCPAACAAAGVFSEILNLEGHQYCCIGSKVTVILLNGWILVTAGASSGRVCVCSVRSRLVFFFLSLNQPPGPN